MARIGLMIKVEVIIGIIRSERGTTLEMIGFRGK